MKAAKGVTDLAATLSAAASAPLVATPAATPAATQATKAGKKSAGEGGTMQMTLRPSRSLYARAVDLAAERSKEEGRSVSVQEIMLEVLEKGIKS